MIWVLALALPRFAEALGRLFFLHSCLARVFSWEPLLLSCPLHGHPGRFS